MRISSYFWSRLKRNASTAVRLDHRKQKYVFCGLDGTTHIYVLNSLHRGITFIGIVYRPWLNFFSFRPFQCFVTAGVCLNMAQHGLVMGFAAILLPQLKKPDSLIPIDDTSGSWIGQFILLLLMLQKVIFFFTMTRRKYSMPTAWMSVVEHKRVVSN